jgi:putative phage-type endonuclease
MSLTLEESRLVGGSDIAPILGLSPYRTPLQVYARIVAGEQQADSAALRRGRYLEEAVLRLYEAETGARVTEQNVRLTHPRLTFTRASLDGCSFRDGLDRVVEVKTAGLSEMRHWGEAGTDGVPMGYVYQCCWYAGVGLVRGVVDTGDVDVAALVAGDLRVYHLPWDAELFAMLEAAVERFWVDHVEPRRPPPVTEPLKDLDAVGSLYPRHDGSARPWASLATPERLAVEEWLRAREEERAAKERRAAWEVRVKLALGTAPQLVGLPEELGVTRIDWKANKDGARVDWEAVVRRLINNTGMSAQTVKMLLQKYTTTTPGARPLVARGST